MTKPSRYDGCPGYKAAPGGSAFAGHRSRTPTTPAAVIEHVVREWDRLDLLALNYYNDSSLWWRILDANPTLLCAADLSAPQWLGRSLKIPAAQG